MPTGNRLKWGIASVLVSSALCAELSAQVLISVGDWEVPLGTTDYAFDIHVTNQGDPISLLGINLNLQIADGGPEAAGSVHGPTISDIDLFVPGALFADNNNGRGGNGQIVPQLFEIGTLTRTGTVELSTETILLARVHLEGLNFLVGDRWDLHLDTLNGATVLLDSQGRGLEIGLEPGQLTVVVPEPAESGLAFAALAMAGCVVLRFSMGRM